MILHSFLLLVGEGKNMAKSVTKYNIVQDFAAMHGLNQETAKMYLDTFVTLIAEGLQERGKVHLAYLGTFERKEVPAKKLYNFHTKELEECPAHGGIKFTPCEALRKDLY